MKNVFVTSVIQPQSQWIILYDRSHHNVPWAIPVTKYFVANLYW